MPDRLSGITAEIFKHDAEFIQECYPEGEIKNELADKDKQKIKSILRDVAYAKYLQELENDSEVEA